MLPARFPPPMILRFSRAALFGVLFALAVASARGQVLRNHFESDGLGRPPAFFDFVVLGAPGPAAWRVTGGHNPPSAPNFAAQIVDSRPKDSIAAALRRNSSYRDGNWSIALLTVSGQGGIVFRMADEKNFLVLLVDVATRDAVLASYRDGVRKDLARGKAATTSEWGFLAISAEGPKVAATWDGKPLLEASDPNPVSGRSGMATAGPGVASFDEFILEPKETR
jgi:hypothetical protein